MSRTNNSRVESPTHEHILLELLEDGSDVGPHGRNLTIWDKIIEALEDEYYDGDIVNVGGNKPCREKHFRIIRKAYIMMKNELGEFTMASQPIRLILVNWFVFHFIY